MKSKFVFLGGSIRNTDIQKRINDARLIALNIWRKGHGVFSAYQESIGLEEDYNNNAEHYLQGTQTILMKADYFVIMPESNASQGVAEEKALWLKYKTKETMIELPSMSEESITDMLNRIEGN